MSYQLVITNRNYETLRQLLFTSDGAENAAFLLCGRSSHDRSLRLLAHTVVPVPLDAYGSRTVDQLEILPGFINHVVDLATVQHWSLVVVHSHPSSQKASFSASDDFGESQLMPVLGDLVPVPHATLLLTPQDWLGRQWSKGQIEPLDSFAVRGLVISTQNRVDSIHPQNTAFDRQLRFWGSAGQARVANLRVGIVGLGGTGSSVAEQLCRLGVQDFVLIDPDELDDTNRSRVYGAHAQDRAGVPKAAILTRHLESIAVQPVQVRTEVESVVVQSCVEELRDRDVVLCCTDNLLSRAVLNRFAYQYIVPMVDMGVRIDARNGRFAGAAGRVTLVGPDLACLRCSGHLDPNVLREELLATEERNKLLQEGYIQGVWEPQPAVISLNSTVASLAVTALLNLVNALYPPQLEQVYDVLSGTVFVAEVRRSPYCEVCSEHGLTGLGDQQPVSTFERVVPA